MSTDSSVGNTGVFWDVDDFPVPEGRGIRNIVESTLKKQGSETEVSIMVYGGKYQYQFTTERADRQRLTFVKRSDKYWRLNKMLLDIGLWVLDTPDRYPLPRNVLVVAKNIKENTEYVRYLENLNKKVFNVLVVFPDDVKPEEVNIPHVKLAWYWKDLLEVGDCIPKAEYRALLDRGERNEIIFRGDDCGEDYSGVDADDRGEDDDVCYRCMHYY